MWEEEQLQEFVGVLATVCLQEQKKDDWVWKYSNDGLYLVRSAYMLLHSLNNPGSASVTGPYVFKHIWKCTAPCKVLSFSWLLLWDRLPTRQNLRKRNVIADPQGSLCVCCSLEEESSNHLFFNCSLSSRLWYSLPQDAVSHFKAHRGLVRKKKARKVWQVFCYAVVWSIWLMRNNFIFNNVSPDCLEILHMIKTRSWVWFVAKVGGAGYVFSDWCISPSTCLGI